MRPLVPSSGQRTLVSDFGDPITGPLGNLPVDVAVVPPAVFAFTGFLQPVDNLPTINQGKAGQSIPVTFSLGGNFGLDILAAAPTFTFAACSGSPVDTIETVSAGGSGLTYDARTNTCTYVWKTQKGWAGQCGVLSVTLTDGTVHTALFQFK